MALAALTALTGELAGVLWTPGKVSWCKGPWDHSRTRVGDELRDTQP